MTDASEPRVPTRDGVLRAAAKIAAILPATPLLPLEIGGAKCWAKAENLQPIGVFKIRGAWHRLSDLSAVERDRGVLGVSSGNHAQGVAWAARRLGCAATIVMPHDAPAVKIAGVRELGADIVFYERGREDRDAVSMALAEQSGQVLVHAYGDAWVIEGQGSAGIEAAVQLGRDPSRFVACCGGGGLAAGLALACPDAEIITVEPEGWDDMERSLRSGTIERVGPSPPVTACDALQTPATYPINFAVLAGRAKGVTVTERQVREAQRFAFSRLKLVLEPGGAAALAAGLAGKVPLDDGTVITLTGGNVDPAAYAAVITTDG